MLVALINPLQEMRCLPRFSDKFLTQGSLSCAFEGQSHACPSPLIFFAEATA